MHVCVCRWVYKYVCVRDKYNYHEHMVRRCDLRGDVLDQVSQGGGICQGSFLHLIFQTAVGGQDILGYIFGLSCDSFGVK
jgi:hypothetical protein